MNQALKGKSPFYPGQPVPVELFTGRAAQIDRIITRGVGQVAAGKPIAMYVQGEYGIGKSSISVYAQAVAERDYGLHAIYVSLGPAKTLDDVGAAVLEATVRSGALNPSRADAVKSWLARYVGEQSLFGITVRADALRSDGPTVAKGLLPFLEEVHARLGAVGARGVFLVLDEINGITANPQFSHLVKGLVDTNAISQKPLPLLLLFCGVEERRREMIRHHQPVDRIFDVIEIETMSDTEMASFFRRAFESARMEVDPDAMGVLTRFAAGFPKIMHLIGDAAYWIDQDGRIDKEDAFSAVLNAADDIGKKYVDAQVYSALKSPDYRSILRKIGRLGPVRSFRRSDLTGRLSEVERKKFDNFLQRMKRLKVIRSGEAPGEYVFNVHMVGIYIWLQSGRQN